MRAVRWSQRGINWAVDATVAVVLVAMMALMFAFPGHEAAPFHVMFLVVAIAYGFRIWPVVPTVVATGVITLIGGWLMVSHEEEGTLARAELAEIALMPAVLGVMVWHARRRTAAVEQMERMAARELEAVHREREFFRDASHAIRTPITIARGHLELISAQTSGAELESDLEVALRQLERMSVLSNRLLALARLDTGTDLAKQPIDLSALVGELVDNWSAASDRVWRTEIEPTGPIMVDPEWIAIALDAVVENAVRFTSNGSPITVRCLSTGSRCTVAIADSGPGIAADDVPHVFERFWHREPPNGPMGSGLGLPMARSAAIAHGGSLTGHNCPGGGAEFEFVLPAERPRI